MKFHLTLGTEYHTFLALNVYRVAIGLLLVGLRSPLDSDHIINPVIFHWLAFSYGAIGFLLALTPKHIVNHSFNRHILKIDMLFTTLLLALNYGSGSGMALVLLPMLTGVAVSAKGLEALKDAISATLLIAGVECWVEYKYGRGQIWHTLGAGLSYMATAMLAERQTALLQAKQAVLEKQGTDIASLEQMNQRIIQDMSTGVVVVDGRHQLYRHNDQAQKLLGCWESTHHVRTSLHTFSRVLDELHHRWLSGERMEGITFLVPLNQRLIYPRWVPLQPTSRTQGAVIYLEDMGEIQSHAQKMKLAALGRLTANIAHEVRNPLSSIRYAAELLHEQHTEHSNDFNLSRIIIQNIKRINHIIEEVMQLNQRDKAQPTLLSLHEIITHLLHEKIQVNELPEDAIDIHIADHLNVWCDPFHLERILWNLISNAWRHSKQTCRSIRIEGRPGYTQEVSVIDIVDDGSGIPATLRPQLFEPFSTSRRQGNGLGLYIARELTEANHGTLECILNENARTTAPYYGAHFRIILPRQALHTPTPSSETSI